jgi:hypothetical protein
MGLIGSVEKSLECDSKTHSACICLGRFGLSLFVLLCVCVCVREREREGLKTDDVLLYRTQYSEQKDMDNTN